MQISRFAPWWQQVRRGLATASPPEPAEKSFGRTAGRAAWIVAAAIVVLVGYRRLAGRWDTAAWPPFPAAATLAAATLAVAGVTAAARWGTGPAAAWVGRLLAAAWIACLWPAAIGPPGVLALVLPWLAAEAAASRRARRWLAARPARREGIAPRAAARSGVVQRLVRRRAADGSEQIQGLARVAVQPGQKLVAVHVAICPPLPGEPRVAHVRCDGPPAAQVQASQVLPLGICFHVRLTAPARRRAICQVRFVVAGRPIPPGPSRGTEE